MFLRNVGSSSSTGFTWPTASTDPGFTHSVDFLGGGQAAGKGFYPVVLQSGRVVMGYGRWDTSGYFAPTGFTYSDDSGVTWNAEGLADAYGPAGTSHNIESIRYQGAVPVPGGVQVWSCPSLSWDPTDSSRAWMISAGRTDDPQASPTDIDLFISRSQITNGVLSFPPDSRYRVTDAQLLIAGEPNVESDEFMPSIGVDQRGGINIAFVRTTTPDGTPTADTRVTVRYARWLSAADLAAGHTPFVQDLSTPFVPRPGNSGNDYIMLTTSGCYVYIAYAADPDGDWNIYAHRVLIPCIISDVTADGVVNSDDVVAFGLAYPPALPQADVNHDGAVNAQDVVDFLNDYACGGCPH